MHILHGEHNNVWNKRQDPCFGYVMPVPFLANGGLWGFFELLNAEMQSLMRAMFCTCLEYAASTNQSNDSSQAAEQPWNHLLVLQPHLQGFAEPTAGGASCMVSMHHWRILEQQQHHREAS